MTERRVELPFDRFDFEQQLNKCWNVTEDIDVLFDAVCNSTLTEDQIANCLLGMKELYEIKFNTLQDMFERGVHQQKIK